MKHMPKREIISMNLVFQIEYDANKAGARGAVIAKIQPFFEKSGHSWVNGDWAVKQLNRRFLNAKGE